MKKKSLTSILSILSIFNNILKKNFSQPCMISLLLKHRSSELGWLYTLSLLLFDCLCAWCSCSCADNQTRIAQLHDCSLGRYFPEYNVVFVAGDVDEADDTGTASGVATAKNYFFRV